MDAGPLLESARRPVAHVVRVAHLRAASAEHETESVGAQVGPLSPGVSECSAVHQLHSSCAALPSTAGAEEAEAAASSGIVYSYAQVLYSILHSRTAYCSLMLEWLSANNEILISAARVGPPNESSSRGSRAEPKRMPNGAKRNGRNATRRDETRRTARHWTGGEGRAGQGTACGPLLSTPQQLRVPVNRRGGPLARRDELDRHFGGRSGFRLSGRGDEGPSARAHLITRERGERS